MWSITNSNSGLRAASIAGARAFSFHDANLQGGTQDTPGQSRDVIVSVVEDDQPLREALAFQLNTAGFSVVTYQSADELLESNATDFDCVVADIFLPGTNGLELYQRLNSAGRSVPVVFVTGSGDLSIGVRAMKTGAVDVLEKPIDDQALLTAIDHAVERSRGERMQLKLRQDLQKRFNSLPARQREVFTMITAGLLNKQVAAEMGITERTVKVHRERLRRKMGADSLAELSRMAEVLQIRSSIIPYRGTTARRAAQCDLVDGQIIVRGKGVLEGKST